PRRGGRLRPRPAARRRLRCAAAPGGRPRGARGPGAGAADPAVCLRGDGLAPRPGHRGPGPGARRRRTDRPLPHRRGPRRGPAAVAAAAPARPHRGGAGTARLLLRRRLPPAAARPRRGLLRPATPLRAHQLRPAPVRRRRRGVRTPGAAGGRLRRARLPDAGHRGRAGRPERLPRRGGGRPGRRRGPRPGQPGHRRPAGPLRHRRAQHALPAAGPPAHPPHRLRPQPAPHAPVPGGGTAVTDLLHPPETASTALDRWRLGEGFLIRAAGQPAEAVAGLRSARARAWAEEVLAAEGRRDRLGQRLRSALEGAVARASDTDRVALINLRRDVFNTRRPRPATLRRARERLDAVSRALLDVWLDAFEAVETARARGAEALAADTAQARAHARAALCDEELRCAILLQSKVLERTMDRYLDPDRKFDKSARHLERTLLELLYRASLKTSPFSTLTSVGLGRFRPGAPDALPRPANLRKRSTVRLNVAVLARLAAVIQADPRLRSGFPVRLAPGADTDGDRMRYVRRRTTAGADPDAVVALDTVHEDLFFLPSGPVLADVAELTRTASPTLCRLSARLAAAHGEEDTAGTDRLLGHLLRLGFLIVPDLQVDLRSDDPATAFTAALRAHGTAELHRAAQALERAGEQVAAYPRTPARERARVLARVREHVEECFAAVGADPDLVPRTLLYEDTTFRGADADRAAAERVLLPDLASLADLLPAFDTNLPRRLTAKEFFVARYGRGGRCDDV